MNICLLANSQSFHTLRWVGYFAGKGHRVHLITFNKSKVEGMDNLELHQLDTVLGREIGGFSFFINTIGYILQTKRLIRKMKPDIVHVHFLTDYGLIGFFTRFDPLVVTPWGTDILVLPKNSIFYRFITGMTLNFARLITCNSTVLRAECRRYVKDPCKIKMIQMGVDTSTYKHEEKKRLRDAPVRIVSTRGFSPVYNIDSIIRAIPYVIKKSSNVHFILKTVCGTEDQQLLLLAESLHVQDNIEIVNKKIEEVKMVELLNSADIFISVPSSDSSSSSLLEAMACGLPVIVSDLPANREWITHGWNGFIVPVRDPERLATSIIECIENPGLMKLFGDRNVQIVRDKADREKHMALMENLYMQLIA